MMKENERLKRVRNELFNKRERREDITVTALNKSFGKRIFKWELVNEDYLTFMWDFGMIIGLSLAIRLIDESLREEGKK